MDDRVPESPIYDIPAEVVRFSSKKKTASFFVRGGVAEPVEKLVRESDFALSGYDPRYSGKRRDSEDFPELPTLDEDRIWEGGIEELSNAGNVLPASLKSLKDLVEAYREDAVSIISDAAYSKKLRTSSKAASGAEKEAKRAEKRNARKAEREGSPDAAKARKSPLVHSLEKHLSRCATSWKVYRYLCEFKSLVEELPPTPSDDEVTFFLSNLEKFSLGAALSSGKKALPMLKLTTDLRSLAIVVFPGARDSLRPVVDAAIKKHSKPQPQAENRP